MNTTIISSNIDHPKLSVHSSGSVLKVYDVTGKAGMQMPLHYSTHEAVVTIKSGVAKIIFENSEHELKTGTTFLIEGGKLHTLEILENFQAVVVMPVESEIKFDPTVANQHG